MSYIFGKKEGTGRLARYAVVVLAPKWFNVLILLLSRKWGKKKTYI